MVRTMFVLMMLSFAAACGSQRCKPANYIAVIDYCLSSTCAAGEACAEGPCVPVDPCTCNTDTGETVCAAEPTCAPRRTCQAIPDQGQCPVLDTKDPTRDCQYDIDATGCLTPVHCSCGGPAGYVCPDGLTCALSSCGTADCSGGCL